MIFDQLDSDFQIGPEAPSLWASFWQSFVDAVEATPLPVLVLWAGAAASTAPVRQVLDDRPTAATYSLEALAAEDEQQFLQRLQRSLPRDSQAAWQQCLSDMDDDIRHSPGHVLVAAASLAAQVDVQKKGRSPSNGILGGVESSLGGVDLSIDVLVRASRERSAADEAVFDQCLEVLAFLPPETSWTVDNMMWLCHLETLGFEPADGRDALEAIMGVWVRSLYRTKNQNSGYS